MLCRYWAGEGKQKIYLVTRERSQEKSDLVIDIIYNIAFYCPCPNMTLYSELKKKLYQNTNVRHLKTPVLNWQTH